MLDGLDPAGGVAVATGLISSSFVSGMVNQFFGVAIVLMVVGGVIALLSGRR